MNFLDSPGKEPNVLTTGSEIWIGQGLVDQAEFSAYIWTFFGYLRCADSLSEPESIGRSNLTWSALPATELGRTVLNISSDLVSHRRFSSASLFSQMRGANIQTLI